jgi:hypothetical protein
LLLAGPAALSQDLKMQEADSAFLRAAAKMDKPALESLLDPDFAWITATGEVRSKSQSLGQLAKMAIPSAGTAESKTYTYGNLGDVQANLGTAHVIRVWVNRSGSWKALVYQEVLSLERPPTVTPGAGKDCQNPCRTLEFTPNDETEREVAAAYMKLETVAHARNSAGFGSMVGDEFAAASSNSDKLQTKRGRMAEFDRSKDGGLAPTPLLSARMFDFGNAVLMLSEHQPDRGNPLHVTRIWVKRAGNWVEVVSYQTAITRPASAR